VTEGFDGKPSTLRRQHDDDHRLRPRKTGYADINGLHLYHEEYGDGSPLVLLHGGMLTIDLNFATLIPTLARRHTVIGVELQGHGRTADIKRPITPAALAGDVTALPPRH
jgi:pimeloyl-ACP methyl ester carboxylesterase